MQPLEHGPRESRIRRSFGNVQGKNRMPKSVSALASSAGVDVWLSCKPAALIRKSGGESAVVP